VLSRAGNVSGDTFDVRESRLGVHQMAGPADLRGLQHYSPVCHGSTRLQSTCWIEHVELSTDEHIATVQLCCLWSCVPIELCVEIASGVVFSPDDECSVAVTRLVDFVNAELVSRLDGSPSSPSAGSGPALRVARVLKRAKLFAAALWPDIHDGGVGMAGESRTALESATLGALWAHAAAPLRGAAADVLSGCCTLATLLSNAALSPKKAFACNPLPPRFDAQLRVSRTELGALLASGRPVPDSVAGPCARASEQLLEALSFFAPLATAVHLQAHDATELQRAVRALPSPALYLLHWMLMLAPVRLVQRRCGDSKSPMAVSDGGGGVACDRTTSDAVAYFAVVHSGLSRFAGASGVAPAGACAGCCECGPGATLAARAWDGLAAQAFGEYARACEPHSSSSPASRRCCCASADRSVARWYHGTASDMVFSLLQGGLRPMSGTRRERTGAMFGPGCYLTNSLAVALQFAAGTGVTLPLIGRDAAGVDSLPGLQKAELRCVCEFAAVAHPDNELYRNGREISHELQQAADACGRRRAQPPDATYLVVKDAGHLHLTGLYVFGPLTGAITPSARSARSSAGSCTPLVGRATQRVTHSGSEQFTSASAASAADMLHAADTFAAAGGTPGRSRANARSVAAAEHAAQLAAGHRAAGEPLAPTAHSSAAPSPSGSQRLAEPTRPGLGVVAARPRARDAGFAGGMCPSGWWGVVLLVLAVAVAFAAVYWERAGAGATRAGDRQA